MDKKEKLSFLKRQFRYLKIRQQQKLLEKKLEEKQAALKNKIKVFTLSKTGALRKAVIGMALLSGLSLGAKSANSADGNTKSDAKNNISYVQKRLPHEIKISGNMYFSGSKDYMPLAQLENVKSGGYYNGVYIDFSKAKPEDVVHTFESGNNPTILNYGATSIKNAQYLGDYQFNLNNTIYELVKYCRKDFPELAKAAGVDPESGKIVAKKARTDRFYQVYCDLCEGEQSAKFARLKFGFMFETHYKPVFEKLHKTFPDFPEITPDNYDAPENFLLSAQVMSTSTQSPGKAFNIIKQQIMNAKLEALKKNQTSISPLDVYKRVSDYKAKNWGHKTRYQKENGLAQDISTYFNAQVEILERKSEMTDKLHINSPIGVLISDNTAVNKLKSKTNREISADLYAMIKNQKPKSGKAKSMHSAAIKMFESFLAAKKDKRPTEVLLEKQLAQVNDTPSTEQKVAAAKVSKRKTAEPRVAANTVQSARPVKTQNGTPKNKKFQIEEPLERTLDEVELGSEQLMAQNDKQQVKENPVVVRIKAKKLANQKKLQQQTVQTQSMEQDDSVEVSKDKVLAAKDTPNKNGTVKKIRLSNNQKVKVKIAQKKSDFRKNKSSTNLYLAANASRAER